MDQITLGNGSVDTVSDNGNFTSITLGNGAGDMVFHGGGGLNGITLGNGADDTVTDMAAPTRSHSATAPVIRWMLKAAPSIILP